MKRQALLCLAILSILICSGMSDQLPPEMPEKQAFTIDIQIYAKETVMGPSFFNQALLSKD